MIIPNHFEDIQTLHQGTQPSRAYYIPASGPMDVYNLTGSSY